MMENWLPHATMTASPATFFASAAAMTQPEYILTLSCLDQRGIVHRVSGFLAQHGCPAPQLLAPFDVWLQLAIGLGFILGALRIQGVDFGSPWLLAYVVGLACTVAGVLITLLAMKRWRFRVPYWV